MPSELVLAFRKVINKHYSAVQTVTELSFADNWKLEKKSQMFWDEFYALEKEFIAKLEAIDAPA